jgi:alpha-glucosidase
VVEFMTEKSVSLLTLIVNLDSAGNAIGTLYEDQGEGYKYQTGDYRVTMYSAAREGGDVVITSKFEGRRAGVSRTVEVRVLLEGREVVKSFKAGEAMRVPLGN